MPMGLSSGNEPRPQQVVKESSSSVGQDRDRRDGRNSGPVVAFFLRYRRWMAFFLLSLGAITAALGLVDLFSALGIGIRLQAALLLAVSAVLMLGALGALADNDLWAVAAAALSSLIAAIIGAYFVLQVITNFIAQSRLVLVLILSLAISLVSFVGAACFCLYLFKQERREGLLTAAKKGLDELIKSAGAATVLAALFGGLATIMAALLAFSQFWYSAQYAPSTAQPNVSIITRLGQVRTEPDVASVTLSMKLHNRGKSTVRVLTSYYVLSGIELNSKLATPNPKELADALGRGGPASRYSRYSDTTASQLIQFGQFLWDQTLFEPGEESTASLVANFPNNRFDSLRLTTDVVVVRGGELEIQGGELRIESGRPIEQHSHGGRHWAVASWPISKPSMIDKITDSDREVVASWLLEDSSERVASYPRLEVFIQHRSDISPEKLASKENRGLTLEKRYGMSFAGSVAELSL